METAYILINCDLGAELEIIQEFMKMSEVKEVRGTYGVYDVFVKLEGDTREIIEEIVTDKIRKTPKVRSTITLTPILAQGGR